MKVALRVSIDDTPGLTEQLVAMFGIPVCSEYRTYWFRYTWIFDSMEEALKAEKIAQSIVGEHGSTEILGPDDNVEEEEKNEDED